MILKKGIGAYERKDKLDLAFSEQTPWFKEFEPERNSVQHEKGAFTAVTDKNITVKKNN